MRRKLIKIGNSTLLLSLPREWIVANNLVKGDELEVEIDEDKLYVWPDSRKRREKLSMDVTEFRDTLPRLLYSLYRSGIDELEIKSKDPKLIEKVKSIIWKEAVGFEIIDQKNDSCRIVSVSGKIEDFENIMRRLFLVTLTMGEESIAALKRSGSMENIIYLEQENNRLTNVLIRAINKYGSHGFRKIGPLYYIIQELEKIGDQLKYMAQFLSHKKGKLVFRNSMVSLFEESLQILRKVYELFYKLNQEKAYEIRKMRNELVEEILKNYQKKLPEHELILLQHSLNIASRSFDMVSSIFILRIGIPQ